jgi:hypothetical protein|tara:strand:- start:1398 stop:1559 length:162 start_codon:yes stop_codon:yes gene_type:complete
MTEAEFAPRKSVAIGGQSAKVATNITTAGKRNKIIFKLTRAKKVVILREEDKL